MHNLDKWFENNKKQLYSTMVYTFFWGLLAHAYCFFDNSVSHDSLNEFHAAIFGNDWKIQLGRIFTPIYRDLFRGDATLPWLIGILALFWLGAAVFLVIRLFEIDSKVLSFLTTGILTTNMSVSAIAATYINDLDSNMLALLCAVAAVYCWRNIKLGEIPGAILLMGSLGIYQAYISVTIVLIMLICLMDLFHDQPCKTVFRAGLRSIAMILAGGILYFVAMKAVTAITGNLLTSGDYNSLDKALELSAHNIIPFFLHTYTDWFEWIWYPNSSYPMPMLQGMTLFFLGVIAFTLLIWFCTKKYCWKEKLLALLLICLLPFAMNIFYFLTLDGNHDLMVYAVWLIYLLALLMADWLWKYWKSSPKKERAAHLIRKICILLVFLVAYGNVQFSNGMYLKKDIEYDAYLSLMTRIAAHMESFEGYIPGETPVVFIGIPQLLTETVPGFREYKNVIGMEFGNIISEPSAQRYKAYFDYVLNVPMLAADDNTWWNTVFHSDIERQMPAYPTQGFIRMENGVLIVKLGTNAYK